MGRIATIVVGAGPAGLLFCIVARMLHARRGGDPAAWPLFLFDKREAYERTHRLRMAPEPYRALGEDLADPRFDALLAFLAEHRFSPEVNLLEEHLSALAAELGVHRELAHVGPQTLSDLRRKLEAEGRILADDRLTIVGADSVHSRVRELSSGGAVPVERTHQVLARLRLVGPDLPESLGVLRQYKLSKVLASILDYRRNANGFAEVDLFLTPREHDAVVALGATPRAPVRIEIEPLRALAAPFFRRIVERLREGFGGCQVWLQSTFRLEHRYMERAVFEIADPAARVFLVGDAAISLPFFRGMACLARCAHALAAAHVDLVAMAARTGADAERDRADVERTFLSGDRPVLFGAHPLFGDIVRVDPTVFHGRPAFVVLHRWLHRYGVHVLHRDEAGHWISLHDLAPVTRATALADHAAQLDPALRYDREVAAIRKSELAVVSARARLVRGAREFIRLSSVLPFPLQTWFLSMPERSSGPTRGSLGVVVNLALAIAATVPALAGPALGTAIDRRIAWIWLAAIPLELAGGAAYAAANAFEGPSPVTRAVWRTQILVLFLGGVSLAITGEHLVFRTLAATGWFVLAIPFVIGLYVFEALDRRWWKHAALDD